MLDWLRTRLRPAHPAPAGTPEVPAPTDAELRPHLVAALRQVYDPEIPVNIYDLGLVYSLEFPAPGVVEVQLTLTAPACPVAGALVGEVQRAVSRVAGVREARVRLVWDPPWRKEFMSEAARLELGL